MLVFSDFGNLTFNMSDTDDGSATLELKPKLGRDTFYYRDDHVKKPMVTRIKEKKMG